MADSLADLTVSMMAKVSEAQSEMSGVNDWGAPTGFCQEFDRLYQDIDQQLRSLRSRAVHLSERIRKHQAKEGSRG